MEAAATAAAEYQRELMLGMSDKARRLGDWAAQVGRGPNSGPERGFENSSAQLRDILRRGLIKMTDLRDDPEWFFEAHRVVGAFGEELGPGFWTRFTVQFNLFAGTVLAVGNADQIEQLNVMQAAGQLGCFALTEKFAGVSSGMVVETTAEFDATTRTFVLNSPSAGAYKNWISQGFCADKSVVVADLRVGGKSHGPHAFLIDFRLERNGQVQLVDGVSLADMGRKTVANDLDNAWIAFDNVRVPESALLDRYACIDAAGGYVPKGGGMHTMEMIGQRLFTGRVAVAEAALLFGRYLFAKTKGYTDAKLCWAPRGARPPLSMLPQLSSLFAEAEEAFAYIDGYVRRCQADLCECLRADRIPTAPLIEAIAVAKVRSVETVIQLAFRLKQAVGSYALMHGSGFEHTDGMQVAKFAEGESFVLLQKMARDRVRMADPPAGNVSAEEAAICSKLRGARASEWLAASDQVYLLAELLMDRTMEHLVGGAPPRGVARPFAKL